VSVLVEAPQLRTGRAWPALPPLVQVSFPPSYQPVACTSEASNLGALPTQP
jgi:hypothetical protein